MTSRSLLGWLLAAGSVTGAGLILGCPAVSLELCNNDPNCDVDGGMADVDSGDSGPPACDPSQDPSCVSEATGVFVSPSGGDSNPGTKAAPLKTIGAALMKASATKPNVYICAGTYAEHVKVTSGVNLVGGFGCADWSYASTNQPKVAPSDAGYALEVEGVTSPITLSDLELDAVDGKSAGESSVAIFVASSSNVTLKRVTANAGHGVAGADPIVADGDGGTAPTGSNATTDMGAGACVNTCGGATSTGGGGGNGAITPSIPSPGLDGGPAIPQKPDGQIPPHDGVGGGICGTIGAHPGADGPDGDGGVFAASLGGHLGANGWTPTEGTSGAPGNIGQGGGGGGGGAHAGATNNGGGGGGGCGGCGGSGGAGGKSGGSSFAVLVYQSTVTLEGCSLHAGSGGAGKAGGSGQPGQLGGFPGSPAQTGIGCAGGTGGNGGAGAGGGGGAGGNAIALGYVGTMPTVTSTTYAEGDVGGGGAGGAGGAGNAGAKGADGLKGDVIELP